MDRVTIRLGCLVPFCRRTHGIKASDGYSVEGEFVPWSEWICREHYRLADERLRRLRNLAIRRLRAFDTWNNLLVEQWLWRKIKRQVMERVL